MKHNDAVILDFDAEPIDDTAVEDVTGIAVYDDPSDHQVDVIPKEFTVIMTKSNVDNTSHGVV